MAGAKRGRPSIFEPEFKRQRARFLRYVRAGNSIRDAAIAAGLGRSTVLDHLARGKRLQKKRKDRCTPEQLLVREWAAEVVQARAEAKAELVRRMNAFSRTSYRATLAILRARYPAEWNPEFMAKVMRLEADDDDSDRPLPGVSVRRERGTP